MAHTDTSFNLSDFNLYTGTPQNNWHMACSIYQKIIGVFEELLDVLMFIVVIAMLYTLEDQPFKIRNFAKSTIF